MIFDIFTLHPRLFESFKTQSLLARAISKEIIKIETTDFRQFADGNYKSVDDRPFGGGHGMVLACEPIFQALTAKHYISQHFSMSEEVVSHARVLPNNHYFESHWQNTSKKPRKITIMLTPRGYQYNQKTAEWLATNFDQIGLVCGRYEGFDARVSEIVDLEISLGDFVLNGGEVAAMALIESVARLIPEFITKNNTVLHDSFSSSLNEYGEFEEYIIGQKKTYLKNKNNSKNNQDKLFKPLFNPNLWLQTVAPNIEHPQYTRPEIWKNMRAPEVLLAGNHKNIDAWRRFGWKENAMQNSFS
jgi:tRNA (guanine37-N1)-methyltransferase